jgi:hypothetical protein
MAQLDADGYQYARAAVSDESLCSVLLDHANLTLEEVLQLDLHAASRSSARFEGRFTGVI